MAVLSRYFIWGGQELFDWPKGDAEVNKSMGMWGVWMALVALSDR